MAANFLLSAAYIDFLEGVGRARLVSRGKVLIKNSEVGTLAAVEETLHFSVSPDESTTPDSGIDPTLPFTSEGDLPEDVDADIPIHDRTLDKDEVIELGFVLEARPIVGEVTTQLELVLALNNIVGQTPSGTPQVRTHAMATTVLVRDGQPICIGGLRRTEDVKNSAKVPVLGSLPLLGYLFGHEANVQRESEMVVVLTPKVILGTEADLEMANEEDDLIREQVLRKAKLAVPKTSFGFDQWLLGGSD
jgi:general secretion pathway protein D